jgi:putative tricarboxylic transport membrane protein
MTSLKQRLHKSRRTVIEAVIWIVGAGVLWYLSGDFNQALPNYKLGPAFWPRVILGLIVVGAIVMLISALIYDPEHTPEVEAVVEKLSSHGERVRMVLIFTLPVLYVYGMHKMGFLLVTPIFLLLYMFIFGVHDIKKLFIVCFGIYAALVLVFYKLIFTPLPQGSGIFYTINGYLLGLIQ